MANTVQNLFNKYLQDGARSSKFDVLMTFDNPQSYGLPKAEEYIAALVRTSSFPGVTAEPAFITFRGVKIPVKGQAKFDTKWQCSFYLTEDHKLKNFFENWILGLNKDVYPERKPFQSFSSTGATYPTTAKIYQTNYDGSEQVAEYTLHNIFPTSIGAVEVDYTSVGNVLIFNVDFAYSHFTTSVSGAESSQNTGSEGQSTVPKSKGGNEESKEVRKVKKLFEKAKVLHSEVKTPNLSDLMKMKGLNLSNLFK